MIYVCAGMTRSGSTWLYNAARVLLERGGAPDIAGGYIGQMDDLVKHKTVIIKLHPFNVELAKKADVILTSHRDLRDVAASMIRKFNSPLTMAMVNEWLKGYVKWMQYADYDLHYENLLTDRVGEIKKIAAVLKLSPEKFDQLDCNAISFEEIESLKFKKQYSKKKTYDTVNLLHAGHITDGRHGSWNGIVPEDLIAGIERECRPWMLAMGYLNAPAQPVAA